MVHYRVPFLLLAFLVFSILPSETDDPCFFCKEFVVPVAQTVVTNMLWVVGVWAASKFTLHEYQKGRLPGQNEQPKKSDLLDKRVSQLEHEKEALSRAVVCLLAAGADTEGHRRTIRQLWGNHPGKKTILNDARFEDAQKIERVLKGLS